MPTSFTVADVLGIEIEADVFFFPFPTELIFALLFGGVGHDFLDDLFFFTAIDDVAAAAAAAAAAVSTDSVESLFLFFDCGLYTDRSKQNYFKL